MDPAKEDHNAHSLRPWFRFGLRNPRFRIFKTWCGIGYTGYDKPGYGPAAVKELERCYKMGARGLARKVIRAWGCIIHEPVKAWGMHLDDPRMKPLLEKCAELAHAGKYSRSRSDLDV